MLRIDLKFFDKQDSIEKPTTFDLEYFYQQKPKECGRHVLTSIRSFKKDFGNFFCDIEKFYFKICLHLFKYIKKRYSSISSISMALIDLSHTLTRFMNAHAQMWSKLDKEITKKTIEKFKHEPMLLVVDDTQLPRKGRKIPFVTKAYDHCKNKFQNAQIVLTIGAISNETSLPLEMLFSNVKGTSAAQQITKNDQLIQWLKDNAKEIKGSILLGD
ncbi:MAG: transposase [Candidatus Parvarchaeota archaeon]|nr:transposase [Candidatus Jingweiarchaeum tengchongense]